jgi:beta-glucanase (GH16 family)
LFSDDFDGAALDETKWHTHYWWADDQDGCSIVPNGELEWYLPDDVLVENGFLRLRAQERTVTNSEGVTYNYTSGMVATGRECWADPEPEKFAFQYGYAEMRGRVPSGQGLWPAFWLLPGSQEWPPEIDVLEILGHEPETVYMTVHYLNDSGEHQPSGWYYTGPDFSAGWHTFGMEWRPDAIIWYIDGVERRRYTDPAFIPHEPMYLILNLAVGGDWPGPPDDSTVFPSYFEVDWVKVWSPASSEPPVASSTVHLPVIAKS